MSPKKTKAQAKSPRHGPRSDFVTILSEMNDVSDRAAAIVSASFVENNLALALIAIFRRLRNEEEKHIFENRGILSDFAGKIVLGYAIEIYESLAKLDLDNIRRIRNKFAHDLEVRDFDHRRRPKRLKIRN